MRLSDVKFDLVVGNPPYQISDNSGNGSGASEGYSSLIRKAYVCSKRYILMIIPSRWYSQGRGKNLPEFRKFMLDSAHIVEFHDFIDPTAIFDNAYVAGGICYFLSDKLSLNKECDFYTHNRDGSISHKKRKLRLLSEDVLVRYSDMVEVVERIKKVDGDYIGFNTLVSSSNPYNLSTDAFYISQKNYKSSDFMKISLDGAYRVLGLTIDDRGKKVRTIRYFKSNLGIFKYPTDTYRVFVPKALLCENDRFCIESIIAKPGDLCTATFLCVEGSNTYEEAYNIASYMKTKFFRYLLTIYKQVQNTPSAPTC